MILQKIEMDFILNFYTQRHLDISGCRFNFKTQSNK